MLPKIVAKFAYGHNAWIVGSAAKLIDGNQAKPRDYDILVPFRHWNSASVLIPEDAKPNTFGGWKIKTFEEGECILCDVWPGDLEQFILNEMCEVAWHPKSNIRIHKGCARLLSLE